MAAFSRVSLLLIPPRSLLLLKAYSPGTLTVRMIFNDQDTKQRDVKPTNLFLRPSQPRNHLPWKQESLLGRHPANIIGLYRPARNIYIV